VKFLPPKCADGRFINFKMDRNIDEDTGAADTMLQLHVSVIFYAMH
jgi:hypothetical protein